MSPTLTASNVDPLIRQVLREQGRLNRDVDQLDAADDLYQAGLTSHACVNIMLGLEDSFDVEFPDAMLKRSVFASIGAIREALTQLIGA